MASAFSKELKSIQGIGSSIAQKLNAIGVFHVDDLEEQNPEQLYIAFHKFAGKTQDPCLLYVFRCAVYFAITPAHLQEMEKLNWWNWKNTRYNG